MLFKVLCDMLTEYFCFFTMKNWIKIILCITVCEAAGILGTVATSPNIPTWYASLNKPSFNPPSWLFGPVWTTLFALMGIALYLVVQKKIKTKQQKLAVTLFGLQLAVNVLWSFLFFGMHQPLWAFVDLVLLWLLIAACIVLFYRQNKWAGILLVPYIAWVSFAGILNFAIYRLNS